MLQTVAVNNIQVLLIKNEVDKDKRILGNSKSPFLTTSFKKKTLFKILKIPVFFKKSPFGVPLVEDFSNCNKKISFLTIG